MNDKQLLEDFVDYVKQNAPTSELPYGFPESISVDEFLLSNKYYPTTQEN